MSDFFSSPMTSLSREPLCLQVARHIRQAIVQGQIDDGALIPSEKQLAAQLGVGRSTVREALRILQSQGLISGGDQVSTRQSTVTSDGVVPSAAAALDNALLLNQIPLQDLVELRVTIERESARRAARIRDPAALAAAAAALAEMQAASGDAERFHTADVRFHEALLRGCENMAFALVMDVVRGAAARHLRAALDQERNLPAVTAGLVAEHSDILDAIRGGDGDRAAALITAHIRDFYARHLP